jgi:hypothetical protein
MRSTLGGIKVIHRPAKQTKPAGEIHLIQLAQVLIAKQRYAVLFPRRAQLLEFCMIEVLRKIKPMDLDADGRRESRDFHCASIANSH